MTNAIVFLLIIVLNALCCWFLLQRFARDGLICGTAVLMACVLFYGAIPILYWLFPSQRAETALYHVLLAQLDQTELLVPMLLSALLVCFMTVCYALTFVHGELYLSCLLTHDPPSTSAVSSWEEVNRHCISHVTWLAHGLLFLGAASMLLCIHGVGGLVPYLALGSLTRGIGKDVTSAISRAYLPFVTLSVVILAPPYLYRFAMQAAQRRGFLRLCFIVSVGMAMLYLLFNQGRVPLLLFLLPFLLDWKPIRKLGVAGLIGLFIMSCLLLEGMQAAFSFLSYGVWRKTMSSSLLHILLQEFTYPFANFANRDQLVEAMGFRYGLDLVQWPLVVLPSGLSALVGVEKSNLTTIGESLTHTYATVTELPAQGGIPSDLFFFLYAQGSYGTLAIGLGMLMRLLHSCDQRLRRLVSNAPARILVLRVSLLMVSCINNFDVAVLLRTRTDLFIDLFVLLWLERKARALETTHLSQTKDQR